MSVTYTILYPHDAEVDIEYYVDKHMPHLYEVFGNPGLVSWKVFKFCEPGPYGVMAFSEWTSVEAFEAAMSSKEGQLIRADVANYSKKSPIIMNHEIVGSSP